MFAVNDGFIAGEIQVVAASANRVTVCWLFSSNVDEIQYECSEWVFTPGLDDDGNELEGFEECAAWQTDVAAVAAKLWPLVASAAREKVSLPDEPPFETHARVQRDDAGALISWCWRQRPDGSDPTILTVVPRELLSHLPCGHCEFIQSGASDAAAADDSDLRH